LGDREIVFVSLTNLCVWGIKKSCVTEIHFLRTTEHQQRLRRVTCLACRMMASSPRHFLSPFLPSVRSESRAISRSVTPVQRSHKPIRPYFSWDGRTVQCVNSVELNILLIVVLLLLALSALTKKGRDLVATVWKRSCPSAFRPSAESPYTHTHTQNICIHIYNIPVVRY
jgi:hypothetical protein